MVFQNYALYPHMTVYDNLAFALKLRHTPKDEIDKKVKEAAEILDITQYLGRKPKGSVRRSASACGHWSCHRAEPPGHADGRASVQPGRQAPEPDAC